jgi:hypothetical protein
MMKTIMLTVRHNVTLFLIGAFLITSCKKNTDDSNNSNAGTVTLLSPPFYNASVSSSYLVPTDFFIDSKDNKWLVCADPAGTGGRGNCKWSNPVL